MNTEIKLPPSSVTPEVFEEWRSPRRGTNNPEQMNNLLWEWLITTRISAYSANEIFKGPSSFDAGPMWCFDRFGQSTTQLPDGRMILVGGEHEDHYDPDFFIYNDLVVTDPSGGAEIYGYPRTVFPPTDFHTATLVDDQIVLIGNLGHPEDRHIEQTQVLVVGCRGWSISNIQTYGHAPGWIHDHAAKLQDDGSSVLVTGGKLFRGDHRTLVENIDEWRLHLDGWRWERLTARRWDRFEMFRADKKWNHLWELRQVLWAKSVKWHDEEEQELKLQAELGSRLRLDVLPQLYRPPIPHEVLPDVEDEYGVYRIKVDGVVIRFVEDRNSIQMTVEGQLAREGVERVRRHVTETFWLLEQSPIAWEGIPS